MTSVLRLTILVALAVVLAVVGLGFRSTQTKDQDKDGDQELVGKPAPDIEGDFAINGKALILSELRGKVVLVDFWAVWCGPCIATFPHLRDWHKEFKDDGLAIVGVTRYYGTHKFDKKTGKLKQVGLQEMDEKTGRIRLVGGLTPAEEQESLKDFAQKHRLEHQLLVLPPSAWRKAEKAYAVDGIPTMVLIDRKGIVRMVKVGADEENIEAIHAEIKRLVGQK
jgi:thiol-disulfide isomerase/thioredoxin